MQTVSAPLIAGKTVLLRLDLDVPFKQSAVPYEVFMESNGTEVTSKLEVAEVFRLEAGLATLQLCLEHAKSVIILGHVGRPEGREVAELSVAPIVEWLEKRFEGVELPPDRLHVLENLRFEPGEETADLQFAQELANLGDFYINEAFASHHPAASTTVLPTLLPHAAGLRFAQEVSTLQHLVQSPKRPFVAVIGGAKIEDKLAVVESLAKVADAVLLGGKLLHEINDKGLTFAPNVMVGKLSDDGFDLSPETCLTFAGVLSRAEQVVWSGPMGKFEDGHNQGNKALAEAIKISGADSILGGGDTIAAMQSLGMLDIFKFVSTGGGAMLKLLADGSLPTIKALE